MSANTAILALVGLVALLAFTATACEDPEERSTDAAADPSAGGAPATGDVNVYVLGEGEPSPCPGNDIDGYRCERQLVLPNGVDFVDPSGLAGAGGAAPDGCEFPVLYDPIGPSGVVIGDEVLRDVNLAVDCQVVPYDAADSGEESYAFADPETRTVIRLSTALCSRLTREGFERIDVLPSCGY